MPLRSTHTRVRPGKLPEVAWCFRYIDQCSRLGNGSLPKIFNYGNRSPLYLELFRSNPMAKRLLLFCSP